MEMEEHSPLTSPEGNDLVEVGHCQAPRIPILLGDFLPRAAGNLESSGSFLHPVGRLKQLAFKKVGSGNLIFMRIRVNRPNFQRRIDHCPNKRSETVGESKMGILTRPPHSVQGGQDVRQSCA